MAGKKRRGDNIHETPDVSYISNPDVSHEGSDVSVGPILKFVFGLLVFAVIVHLAMWLMFNYLEKRETAAERRPSPLARQGEERLPPEPRLQLAPGFGVTQENGERIDLSNGIAGQQKQPQSEYWTVRDEWARELNNYGWADETSGSVRIPIDDAIRKYAQEQQQKNPAQQQGGQTPPAGSPQPGAQQPRSTGETVPMQSGSGRVEEQRHQ